MRHTKHANNLNCLININSLITKIMTYNIIDIEGVGDAYAEKLKAAGIKTVDDLLDTGGTAKGRKNLAETTGISEKLILRWVNHADLFRINGVGPHFAELLEAVGVDTVKEMRHRNAENLAAKMAEVNEAKHLTRRSPSAAELQKMIDEAGTLEPRVTY